MDLFKEIVDTINSLVWETPSAFPLMIALLLSFGIFITFRLGIIQVRKFGHGVKVVLGFYDNPEDEGDVNHFQALSTALSATVGIGNIAGVAIAIHYGGPGALFWMWLTAILGMAIKYAECTLAVHYRQTNADGTVSGGPMYYIEKGLGPNWKWLAVTFAAAAVICSFLTGNAVQANTVADTVLSTFSVPTWVTGVISAGLVGVVILGGIKRIGNVTAKLAPLMALIYVGTALIILLLNYTQIIPTLGYIIESAFNPTAGAFGVGSGFFMTTMVWGIKRGLFSNEAGQGSAPIAHAAAKTDEPVREGVVALLEPFIDTLMICTMTGLVIIITNVWQVKHPAQFSLNGGEVSVEFPMGSKSVTVTNGIVENGVVKVNDFKVDTLYYTLNFAQPFNGVIKSNADGAIQAESEGKNYAKLTGNIVENGAPLTALAFERGLADLFPGGRYIVTLCVLLFGISTSISWSYYGDRAIQYLLGDGSIKYYKGVYVLMHFVGAVLALSTVWAIGDIMLGLMAIPNIIALFALSGVVYTLTKTYFAKNHDRPED
ncbi:sodium:alanine symporter family protein [bacterium]|nr:MAG: sodium:alanine symporter family protein [bacterium]